MLVALTLKTDGQIEWVLVYVGMLVLYSMCYTHSDTNETGGECGWEAEGEKEELKIISGSPNMTVCHMQASGVQQLVV